MKFQPDTLDGVNNITHHDAASLRVNGQPYGTSLLVPWQGTPVAWDAARPDQLTEAHFDALLGFDPEVVVFGSGPRLRFVSPALYRGLIQRGIGMETMDSGAACRTYTVLANEGRRVVAAILLDPPAADAT
ncbi:MAG TPA: Mth938-like domain-containing protein [Burkholderiaceae bacterium]